MADTVLEDQIVVATHALQRAEALTIALRDLLQCANAIVGADQYDPEAAEAFAMFDAARRQARVALGQSK